MSDDAAEREARMAVSAAVLACMAAEGREETEAALDAHREAMHVYALAVRASMPCYRDRTGKDPCRGAPAGQDNPFAGDEPLCPSCTAKAEQQEAT
jgi:hypothetical protein